MTAQQLARWRAGLSLTQREAAEALGLSLRQYARLEAGDSPVSQVIELACKWIKENAK